MRYRIEVRGRVSARVARHFPGFDAVANDVTTDLTGEVEDQAGLLGAVDRARSLGLDLVAVVPIEPLDELTGPPTDGAGRPDGSPRRGC